MPKVMSSNEIAKYTPLEQQNVYDDDEIWDGEVEFSSHGVSD